MRWWAKLVVLLGVAALSSCVTAVWIGLDNLSTPSVPLTRGLEGLTSQVGPRFDERIRRLFPIGSSDRAMGIVLARNGFERQDWTTVPDGEHEAARTQYGPCRFDFTVSWRSDAQGRLTSVRGDAAVSCL